MASIGLGFTLSANAQGMSSGINAGVVELQKLGYAAKKTQQDVSTLKTIELSRVFLSSVQTVAGAFNSFVAGSASAVASVDDLSKRTGVSTQTLQAYQFAAEQSGVSVETFGKGVQKLGINLGEAQTGNKGAIKSFARPSRRRQR
jgi:predicted methyltransferase MtxX (methanogen marker protein 4)